MGQQSVNKDYLQSLIYLQQSYDPLLGSFSIFKKDIMPFDFIAQYNLQAQDLQNITIRQRIKTLMELQGHCQWLQHYQINSQDAVCGKQPNITVYFSYFKYTLKDFITKRSIQNNPFKQQQTIALLKNLIIILKNLQLINIPHCLIKPQSIFYDQMRMPRLKIRHLIRPLDKAEYQRLQKRSFTSPQDAGMQQCCAFKQDVFALGMTILQVITLMDCCDIFYKNRRPLLPAIKQYLNKLKHDYPRLIKVLKLMLHPNPNQRIDFKELHRIINQQKQNKQPRLSKKVQTKKDIRLSIQSNKTFS